MVTENREKWGWESGGVRVMPTPEQMAKTDALFDRGEPDGGASGSLALRGRVATASLALFQVERPGRHLLEFGFNPGQRRGPDGRFIKMGGRGSAGKGGFPKGHRPSEGGGAGAGGSTSVTAPKADAHGVVEGTRAADLRDAQTERVRASKRTYRNGDKVPLADGTQGTVVGGHHVVPGRPGQYVAVRPDSGGKLKEVAVDAIRKRQAAAEVSPDASPVAAPTAATAPPTDPPPPPSRAQRLEENARKMYGDDESTWPAHAKRDIAKIRRETAERPAAAPPAPSAGVDRGPAPVGFKPHTDAEWALLRKRLGKRTARTDPEGDLQVGDVVPTRDAKWQTVEGGQIYPRRDEGRLVNVKDDAKGYRHTEDIAGIKRRIEEHNAELAWREQGGSQDRLDGKITAEPTPSGRRPGEPEIGPDGKYAKPTKQYAVWNGVQYDRTSRNPYRYASVVASRNPNGEYQGEDVWSWHATYENAARGTLTGSQRQGGLYVKQVVETQFENPGAASWQATPAEVDAYDQRLEQIAREIRDRAIDFDERPGSFDQFRERELSDRLQELSDAQAAGNADGVTRAMMQIRRLLLASGATTVGALPPIPRGRAR